MRVLIFRNPRSLNKSYLFNLNSATDSQESHVSLSFLRKLQARKWRYILLAEKHLRLTRNVLLCHPNAFIHKKFTNFLMHLVYCIYKVVHVTFLRTKVLFFSRSCRREEKLNYVTYRYFRDYWILLVVIKSYTCIFFWNASIIF